MNHMPVVAGVDTAVFTVPTDAPEADGTLSWDSTTLVLATVRSEDVTGLGYTYAPAATASIIADLLADVVTGLPALDVPRMNEAMHRAVRNAGLPGVAAQAIAAVDIALWDMKARMLGLPLVHLLGAARADVPVYGSGGFTTYDDDQQERQLRGWVETDGIPRVKIKIGESWGSCEERDRLRVAKARAVIGDATALYVDANGGYGAKQAVRVSRALTDEGVTWFEEPVSSDHLSTLAAIRDQVTLDVAAGEYGYTLPYFEHMLASRAVDCLQADITRCGGITGERGVVVGPHGDFAWMCAPRWHSDAVFSTLIGGSGVYTVTPVGRHVWGGHYEDGSLIWRSRWVTEDGIVECREALAFPGDPHTAVILRRIVARDTAARVSVVLQPAAGFGRHPQRNIKCHDDGTWTARTGDLRLRWSGGPTARPTGPQGQALTMDLTVGAGNHHDLVLEISDRPLSDPPPDAATAWRSTEAAWRQEVPALDRAIARRDARQSYAVLRGLTGSGGGMVAATTTSLPERAEEGRNYDYRYVWIRDQSYAGQAAAVAGGSTVLDSAVRFVTERLHEDGPRLAPAYTVDGRRIPDQRTLDLPGYPGGFDRVGNQVNEQFQLDGFGEALLLLASAARHDRLDADAWRAAQIAADAIAQRHHQPDAGVWELSPRNWAHSRLTCAAGLRAIAHARAPSPHSSRWMALADRLVADTAAQCLHPSGRWQRSPADPGLDGALLLPPLRGALPADDVRTIATLRAYTEELTDDHFAYRFRHDERPLEAAEGAFLLCGFVMALAEHQQGREVAAHRWFERNRAACGPAGLYSEEYDVSQRQMRGNLPQAFVHALMLECSVRLAEPWVRP